VAGELKQAARALQRTPLLSAAAVACLSGAIAASTAVFAVVDAVVVRPLPFAHARRLVAVWGVDPSRDTVKRPFSWPDIRDISRSVRTLDGVAAMSNAPDGLTLTGSGDPVRIPARIVSGNFFEVLGVGAAVGRTLSADDDRAESPAAVTISDALWRQRFGSDPDVTSRAVTIDGRPFRITGVAPRGFAYPPGVHMWVTVTHGAPDYVENRDVGWLEVIGRMQAGVTVDQARSELSTTFRELSLRYHASRGPEALSVVPLDRELVGDTRLALWALLAAVGVLLAIACANVGGLLLVRGAERSRDLAVRLALGAGRAHVFFHALAESLVLLTASAAVGVLLAFGLVATVRRLGIRAIPRIDEVHVDAQVLLFALVVTAAVTIVCALIPAMQASSGDPMLTMSDGERGSTGERHWSQRLLAASEVAMSVALLVAAGLVWQTFVNLRSVDVGFDAAHVIAFDVPQPAAHYPTAAESLVFADRFLPRVAILPGVRHAAAVLLRPLWGVAGMDWPVRIEGQSQADSNQNPLTNLEAISSGYFATLGIPVLEGREISVEDREGRPGVAVVGRSFARRFWPNSGALGRRLQIPLPGSPYNRQWLTVVGVVGDARYRELQRGRLDLYISSAQCPYGVHQFVVRTAQRPETLAAAIRAEIRQIDGDLPIDDVVVLSDVVDAHAAGSRVVAVIFAAFAATATVLAALGLGTLIAWQVRRRSREIGIRIALGATAERAVRTIMREAVLILAIGLPAGLLAATVATTFLRSILYEVAPHDPRTMVVAAVVAGSIGLLSAYVPARRTTRADPLIALRQE
jgi:putative ABC transport system permease protein